MNTATSKAKMNKSHVAWDEWAKAKNEDSNEYEISDAWDSRRRERTVEPPSSR